MGTKFQWLPHIFGVQQLNGTVTNTVDVGRQPEIAVATCKPEVVVTQERHEISARFQRILDIFDHTLHAVAIANIVRCRPISDRQAEISNGGQLTGSSYNSGMERASKEIWTATPTFFGHALLIGTGSDIVLCRQTTEIAMAACELKVVPVITQERHDISAWIYGY